MRTKAERNNKKTLNKSTWPVTRRWLAMGSVAVYSAIGIQLARTAQAQTPSRTSTRPGKQEKADKITFNIPAGPLDSVLDGFQTATGLQVEIPNAALLNLSAHAVSGQLTAEEALTQALEGTGVDFKFNGPNSVLLELHRVATAVEVTASVDALAQSNVKFSTPLNDTPQTISSVPEAVMDEQNVTTLRDTLRNVAGISLAAGEGGAQGDNLTVRGFNARNDLFIDGMRDFGSYYRDPFNLQQVDVMQGPAAVQFGRGSTGGAVNQATKTPGMSRSIGFDLTGGTDGTRRVTADVNTPINDTTAFRLNLMGNEGNVAGRDVAENRRFGVAPSLSLGLGTPTRLTFSYFHQTADDIPDYGIPWLFNGPAPVNRRNYYGFEKGNFLRTCDDIGTIRVEHDFNAHFTLRNQLRYANYVRDGQISEAQILGTVTPASPLSAIQINRNQITVHSIETYFADQLDLVTKFDTGRFHHNLVSGVEVGRETSDPTRPKFTNVPTTSLLNPDPSQTFSGIETISSDVHTTSNTAGVYAIDTVELSRKWQVMGGLRWDRFNTHYTQNVAPASAFNRLDEMTAWRAGIVYKPAPAGTIYVSAGTSFNPSAETLALSAANANLPPEKNRTEEVGVKWTFHHDRLNATGAVFRTEKTNAREPDPTNSLLNVLAGNQRVDGVQIAVNGHVTSRWEVMTGYALLDAKVVSSNYYPAAVGAQLANVPRHTYNFWSDYRVGHGWEVGAGANFVASRTASSTVPLDPVTGLVKKVPGYWIFSAMAERRLNEHVRLQANVYNIANRYYYDQLHPAHIVPGAGRSALIGLKFQF
jgi:catecholate siderophore receptor